MLQFILTADTHDELRSQLRDLAALLGGDAPPDSVSGPPQDQIGTEDDQPELPLDDPQDENETPEPDPPEQDVGEEKAETKAARIDVDTLRNQLMRYAEQHGNTKANKLVAKWGKVSKVPADKREEVFLAAGGEL